MSGGYSADMFVNDVNYMPAYNHSTSRRHIYYPHNLQRKDALVGLSGPSMGTLNFSPKVYCDKNFNCKDAISMKLEIYME